MSAIELDDYRPHVTVPLPSGAVHVMPADYLRQWSETGEGKRPPESVLRVIVGEWLDVLEARA